MHLVLIWFAPFSIARPVDSIPATAFAASSQKVQPRTFLEKEEERRWWGIPSDLRTAFLRRFQSKRTTHGATDRGQGEAHPSCKPQMHSVEVADL